MQSEVHPDKFAHLSDAERRMSMQWATLSNEAYQTLRKPLSRARYLLKLNQVDTQEETNTAMPAAFLMEQMELREALEEAKSAKDAEALDRMEDALREKTRTLLRDLEQKLDVERDYSTAAEMVRKLRFLEKLGAEIGDAYEAIEA